MAKKNIKTPQITVPAQPYIELPTDLKGELVAHTLGYNHLWYGLFACKNLDYRETDQSGASFAKINPNEAQNYRILAYSAHGCSVDLTLTQVGMNYHYIQPLPNGEFLLACARSRYRAENKPEAQDLCCGSGAGIDDFHSMNLIVGIIKIIAE